MADLTSLYPKNAKRDLVIQTCVDCINFIGLNHPEKFIEGSFTEFFDISGGTQPPKSKFIYTAKEGYVRFLQIRDFSNEDTLTYIPESKNNKLCKKEDILLGRYGASIGKILTGKSGAYNVACAKVSILKSELIDNAYLFYWLHNSKFQSDIKSFSRSAQGGFNKNDLSRIRVSLPALGLQKDLVSLLNSIDQAIVSNVRPDLEYISNDKLIHELVNMIDKFLFLINEFEILNIEFTQQLTLLENLNQAILQEAVQGKLVPQDPSRKLSGEPATELLKRIKAEKAKSGKKEKPLPPIRPEEIPFEIPESWVWCRLGEITNYGSSPKAEPTDLKNDTWVLDLEDIEKTTSYLLCKIRFNERNSLSTKSVFKTGDVLYSKLRPYLDKVIVADEDGVCTTEILPLKCFADLNPFYLKYALKRADFLKYVNSKTKGMKMPRLGTKEGEMALIPLPPLSEQKRIVAEIEKQKAKTRELKEHVIANQQATEQLLKAMLHEAFEVSGGESR